MKEAESANTVPLPGWAIGILLLPVGLVLGFAVGDSLLLLLAAVVGLLGFAVFLSLPLSVPVKLVFVLISLTFLQKVLGYFKVGEVRGLNIGNLLLLGAMGYWFLTGLRTRRFYRPTPIDLWLLFAVVVVPLFSIVHALVFRKTVGYSWNEQFSWYKQWVTPFVYFFLLTQGLDRRKDIHYLFVLVPGLLALAVLWSLPETLRFSSWHGGRTEGFLQQANDYAALLATTSPFLFLVVFLFRDRPRTRILALALLGGMGISILMTYSRAGYVGFAIALVGSLYLAYRATGRIPLGAPALVIMGVCAVPVIAAPQLLEYVESRFAVDTYKRAKRKSYTRFSSMNQYSGDRLEIWTGAVQMAQDNPIFGVGFHAFELELPKYHPQGTANYPHNQFLGALAEGGVTWLLALAFLYWKLWRFLWQAWRLALREEGEPMGLMICGGALLAFAVMIWISLSNDFLNPGPKCTIFWVVMAGAVKYGLLRREPMPAAGVSSAIATPVPGGGV
jgi:putative inorganic carbon (HCO3(-)) transporter